MKYLFRIRYQSSLLCLLFLAVMPALATANPAQAISPTARAEVQAHYGHLPLSFEVNQGQVDSKVKFLVRGHGYGLFLTPTEAVLSLQTSQAKSASAALAGSMPETRGTVLRMQWVGGNPSPRVVGLEATPGRVNYLLGNDQTHWHTGIQTYTKVAYEEVYPGVDLVYYGHQSQLEYDVVVAPKANPRAIRLAFRGADRIEVNAVGELVLYSGNREIQMHKPVIYQEISGIRKSISGGYMLNAAREVGFDVGAYDHSHPLVIDPVLAYATYLGGNNDDRCAGIAVDGNGNAYVTGVTYSANFPITSGAFQPAFGGVFDAFVAKLNPTGTALVYATYIGGNIYDEGTGIAVDGNGNAFVSGFTNSTNFPATPGAFQPALSGGYYPDSFVAKLNPTGTALVYATYLGGNNDDRGAGVAVDGTGNAYVSGWTTSANFPITSGAFQPAFGGGYTDTFMAKLNPTGTALIYANYLGGKGIDSATGIAVDSIGNAYVTGFTNSTDFPTTSGSFQPAFGGPDFDAYVAKLNSTGTALVYATYLGGNAYDDSIGIAVDGNGNAFVSGETGSANFPTTPGAFQTALGGQDNAYVAKLNPTGTALVYATYLGGKSVDGGFGIAVDGIGNAFVTGFTNSTNFPTTSGAFQPALGGVEDAFVAKLNSTGTALVYATYLGGNSDDGGVGITVDGTGDAFVSGWTTSANFPNTPGGIQPAFGGSNDAFVAKLNIPSSPINKDQCKNGGWKNFNNPTFKNEGQCVSFVEHHKKDGDNHDL